MTDLVELLDRVKSQHRQLVNLGDYDASVAQIRFTMSALITLTEAVLELARAHEHQLHRTMGIGGKEASRP